MICRVIDVDIMGDGIRCDGVILRVDSVLQTKLGKLDEFARLDGFGDWESMRDWFRKTHALPFNGDLVKWVWSPVRAVKGVSS